MVEFNPYDWNTAHNPYPVYQQLRDEAPVYHNERFDFWAISRHADVLAAHNDFATFASGGGVTIEGYEKDQPLLIVKDPPQHTWHRKVVARVFTPRRIGDLEPFIRNRAGELLDAVRDQGTFDAVEQFSTRLPLDVISELIGIPEELRETVHQLSDQTALRDHVDEQGFSQEQQLSNMIAMLELYRGLVQERRRNLGDDVISLMITTPVVDADGNEHYPSDDELATRFQELGFAGHETVAKLIANGIVALDWYPDQRRELAGDFSLMRNTVEEMLRWDPPSHLQGRTTTRDVELHGVTIPEGSKTMLVTGAATHDEREYDDPELFDIHRDIAHPVSFGFGMHVCLGAHLARLETRIAFEELLSRYPDFHVEEGVVRHVLTNVRGVSHLPVTIDTFN